MGTRILAHLSMTLLCALRQGPFEVVFTDNPTVSSTIQTCLSLRLGRFTAKWIFSGFPSWSAWPRMDAMRFPLALLAVANLCAQSPERKVAREIFKQLMEINTTDSEGNNTRAAEAMAARFRDAGYPSSDIQVLEPMPRKGNLVLRLHGSGSARPILFIGHLDVVEAKRSD